MFFTNSMSCRKVFRCTRNCIELRILKNWFCRVRSRLLSQEASWRVNVKRRSQIKINDKERQEKWDEHKQPGTKGKYWNEMRENIKSLAKSFKRERVHAAFLRHMRFVIISVRKRSFPVYEPASSFLLFSRVFRAFTCRPTDTADDMGREDDKSIWQRGNT